MTLDLFLSAFLVAGAVIGVLRGIGRTWVWATAATLGALATLSVWGLSSSNITALSHALAASFTGLVIATLGFITARWFACAGKQVPSKLSRTAGGGLGAVLGASCMLVALPVIAAMQPDLVENSRTFAAYQPERSSTASLSKDVALPTSAATGPAGQTATPVADAETETSRVIAWTRVVASNGQRSQTYTGTVRATDRAQLSFEITGDIAEILVKVGDTVSAGDVLARLDETPLRLAVAEREARVAEARAVLEEARADFRRQQSLFRRRVIAEARLERAQLALSTAESRLKSAEAARKSAEDSLSSALLRAPFEARVSAQLREASEIAMAGSPVLELEGLSSGRELVVSLPEEVVSRITIGDTFPLDGTDGTAVITEIGSRARGGATFPVILALQTETPVLTGATRSVRVQYQAHARTVMIVPLGAVAMGTDRTGQVFVYDETTKRVSSRGVTIERYRRDAVEVTGELAPGQIIASRGAAFLNDGEAVDLLGVGVARFER
ncbi:MAG: efflux RND transporter periplasmic adaptor subunit [Pseudomonadota bacterium]